MKKLIAALLLIAGTAFAQNPNPQPSYVQTVESLKPSVWLRFNDNSSTTFLDNVSGLNFSTTFNYGLSPISPSSTTDQVHIEALPAAGGALSTVSVYYPSAPVAGTQTLIMVGALKLDGSCGYSSCYNQTDSFYVSPTMTAGWQTFTAGTGYTARNVPPNSYLGVWQSSTYANGPGQANDSQGNAYYVDTTSAPSNSNYIIYPSPGWTIGIKATITGVAATPRQPGFDATLPNNYSVSIPYNGWIVGPNNTLGDFEWNVPTSVNIHVDALKYNQLGGQTLTLASKGVLGSTGWDVSIQSSGLNAQVCFNLHSALTWGPHGTTLSTCTSAPDNAVIPGYGLDITAINAGTGWAADNLILINGLYNGGGAGGYAATTENDIGLGSVNVTLGSGGSGYTSNQYFSSRGGGTNCYVEGFFGESGGVLQPNPGFSQNSGCSSAPTIVLTSPTGTGATPTAAVATTSISTASPLMIGSTSGLSTDANQSAVNVDEFAEYPSNIGDSSLGLEMWTKFYQQILGTPPATPPLIILDDDGETDLDNQATVAVVIGAAKLGYIHLIGIVSEDGNPSCPTLWLQMLQQAGLGNVPIGIASTGYSGSGGTGSSCSSAGGVGTYNASSPTAYAAFTPSVTLYRTLFAKYPATPIKIINDGAALGIASFMQSAADGISSLTGLQLMSQNATNGGAIYMQGYGNCNPSALPALSPCSGTGGGPTPAPDYNSVSAQYLFANNGTTPIYFHVGTPTSTGGVVSVKTAKDPFYLYSTDPAYGDNRPGWDTMTMLAAITSRFHGGIMVGYSGGTGYATYTPISASGGGGAQGVIGYLHATGGVPDAVYTLGGENITTPSYSTYYGIGYGYTSLPTLALVGATGTGVTLTPTLNDFCLTLSDNGQSSGSGVTTITSLSGTCTTHQYLYTFAPTATPLPDMPIFTYLANSLIGPTTVPAPKF